MVMNGCEVSVSILALGLLPALPRTARVWLGPRAWLWSLTWAAPPHSQPQTPHLEEDLKEVLRSEAGIELIIEDEARPEKQKRKAGVSGRWGWRSPSWWSRGDGVSLGIVGKS